MPKALLRVVFVLAAVALVGAGLAGPALAGKVYRVEARTTTFGGSSYILGFGICDLLNKHSEFVRGSVLESTGTPENIKLVGRDPKRRARTFFTLSAEMFDKARAGEPPFAQPAGQYKDLMVMAFQQSLAGVLITLDPEIKTLTDLKGKRVSTWPRGTTKYELTRTLIGGAGQDVLDSVKWQFTGYAGYNDMILGKVDAAFAFLPERGPGVFTTVPKLKELMTKHKVYFVTATKAMRQKSAEMYGPIFGITSVVPAGALAEGIPRDKVIGWNILLAWGVYPEMPEKVVYEIMRVMDEYRGDLATYHSAGKNVGPDRYGAYPAAKDLWHPGARKFFEDKGIPYGQAYFDKAYPQE